MADDKHETKIVISGEASGAASALGKVTSGLNAVSNAIKNVSSAVGKVTQFLSRLNWAISAVQSVIAGFNWLKDKIHETERKARELREEFERLKIDERLKHEAASYDKLNKALAETVRLEKERNDILAGRKTAERALEDADAELRKQGELASLDPADKDYASKKDAIERKYQLEANEATRARAEQDSKDKAADLYRQADAKEAEANRIEAEYKKALKTEDLAIERNHRAAMAARGGDSAAVEKHKETDEQWKKAHDAAVKIKDAMEAARKDAQSLRNRAGEMAGGNLAANMKAQANAQRIENERREKEAKDAEAKRKEAEAKQKEEAGRQQKLEDATLERQKQEDIAALNPLSKTYRKDKREIERTYAQKAIENEIARATNDTDREAAQEKLKALQESYRVERNEEFADEQKKQASDLEHLVSREASADAVSQNRLTAMGLGSGVSGSGGVASDVKRLVELLKQNVEATKNIKLDEGGNVAVYGE